MDRPSRWTVAAAGRARIAPAAAELDRRLEALQRRDDARFLAAEIQEIRARVGKSLRLARQPDGGWHEAAHEINGAKTWLLRLEGDLKRMDGSPHRWRDLVTERRALPARALAVIEQRAFRTARFMATDRCPQREATAMARRAEQALADGCPATSALINERVRRALRAHPDGIVDPLVRMLRLDSAATLHDAVAVLRALTRLPAAMACRLADAGVTIHPSPDQLGKAMPGLHGTAGDRCDGFYCKTTKRLIVKTTRHPADDARICAPRVPLHEAAHVCKGLPGTATHDDPDFMAARQSDMTGGQIEARRDDYYREADPRLGSDPGSETFAESLSMYLLGNKRWPSLHAYWAKQLKSGRQS